MKHLNEFLQNDILHRNFLHHSFPEFPVEEGREYRRVEGQVGLAHVESHPIDYQHPITTSRMGLGKIE